MQTETKTHPPNEQHILLTSLGRHAIETEYKWQGDRKITASLTPLALVQFLKAEKRPNRVVTLVTEAAEQDNTPFVQGEAYWLDTT